MRRKYEILAAIICLMTTLGLIYYQFTIRKPAGIPPTIKVIYQYPTSDSDDDSYDDIEDTDAEDLK